MGRAGEWKEGTYGDLTNRNRRLASIDGRRSFLQNTLTCSHPLTFIWCQGNVFLCLCQDKSNDKIWLRKYQFFINVQIYVGMTTVLKLILVISQDRTWTRTWTDTCCHLTCDLTCFTMDPLLFRGFTQILRAPCWAETKRDVSSGSTNTHTHTGMRTQNAIYRAWVRQLMMVFIVIHVLIYSLTADPTPGCNMQMLVCFSMGIFRSTASSCH